MKKPMVIGVTGSFGSGKTTVAGMFGRLGAYVIDADKLYHSLIRPGAKLYRIIVRHFGRDVLKNDRSIDRHKLSRIVFSRRSGQRLLNRVTHPRIMREIRKIIELKGKKRPVIVDAAMLIESGFYKEVDYVVIVRTRLSRQLERLSRMRGVRRGDALTRIRTQAPVKKKAAHADFIIDNSDSKNETFIQVKKIWKKLRSGYASN